MNFKSVVVTDRGGLEAVKIMENELRAPGEEEARVRVLAAPVCQDDIAIRIGNRPFLKETPFVPGYTCVGIVDAVGANVAAVSVGERVAAFTNYGSHAEYLYWNAEALMPVPESLDPAEAAILMLNYVVAYQSLHRVAQAQPGDKALIIGASGGVGTAFMQLGELAGVKMFGLASPSKHATLRAYGVTPIDYHTQDFVQVVRQAEPEGIDYVFNGMGEEYFERGLAVLRRGGKLVAFGAPQSFARFLLLVVKLIFYNLLPNGKKIMGYGTHRLGIDVLKEDWATLFTYLEEGKIKPIIVRKFPLLEAPAAYELLESGKVTGNLVLLAPELL